MFLQAKFEELMQRSVHITRQIAELLSQYCARKQQLLYMIP